MTKECILEIKDEVNIKWHGLDPNTRRKLVNALKFFMPHAKYSPQYKLGRWDGNVSYCDIGGRSYINLLDKMLPIVEKAGYEIHVDDKRPAYNFEFEHITNESYSNLTWPEGHPAAGENIIIRDHQVQAVNSYLDNMQSVNVAPTAAGKTLISVILSDKIGAYGRSIVIVPSKDLVTQTEEDYKNFGMDVGVYFGDRKEYGKTHTICTWQSLESLQKATKNGTADVTIDQFLDGVIGVVVDECHRVQGAVLRNLLAGPLKDVPIRWGMTGTLPELEHDKVALEACVGKCESVIKASQLQEAGIMANLDITICQLQDNRVFSDYQDELKWLTTDRTRLQFIADAAADMASDNGNTLILIDRIETGEILEELIPNSVFLKGNTKSKDRKEEYKSMQNVDGKVIIATYGIASTGISISRIFNLILFEPGKSFVRVIQSIGRGLRVAKDKDFVNVFDITSTCKFSRRHMNKRRKFYNEAEYPNKILKVDYSKK